MRLYLFGTPGCHLCEEAETLIEACIAKTRRDIAIEAIDIADQKQWQEHYALRIPILYDPESKRELAWPFDEIDIAKFMASCRHFQNGC